MKSRSVETVASDEENLRLRIYDGEIPLTEAGRELNLMLANRLRLTEERLSTVIIDNRILRARYSDTLSAVRLVKRFPAPRTKHKVIRTW